MNRVKTDTIIRTVVLIIALINQVLTARGKSIIPVSDDQIAELISLLFTIGASVWAWWKNNSYTDEAIEADKYLDELRRRNKI